MSAVVKIISAPGCLISADYSLFLNKKMTTLKVTIDNKKNARLLSKVLQNMKFVKKIEEEDNVVVKQYESLNELFDGIGQGDIFNEINEPVEWQKKIRDEW